MLWTRCLGGVSLLAVLGCSDSDSAGDLSRDEVQDIEPGTARGAAASGRYEVEAYTAACDGICAGSNGFYTFTICDVGDRDEQEVEVEQTDGRLQIDGDESLFVSRLVGGIDVDGSFDVGGYGTEAGGAIEATGRMIGGVDGDHVTGVFDLWVRGRYDGEPVDCRARYEVEGTKRGSLDDDE